jgi:phosphatidylglycerophosphatase C
MTVADAAGGVAFFDFDDTLIHGDSLLMFLEEVAGVWTARRAFVLAAAQAWRDRALGGGDSHCDFKTAVKAAALRQTLTGATREECRDAAQRTAARLRWDDAMLKIVENERAQGRRIVLATGALDVYLPELLGPLGPLAGMLATEMAVADGRLTGEMASANCVRAEKARRVREWLTANPVDGPAGETTVGYGNRPSDLPMLGVLDQGFEVRLTRGGGAPKLTPYVGEG